MQLVTLDVLGISSTGNRYYGQTVNGKPEGWGFAHYEYSSNGWYYNLVYGQWKEGKLQGPGVYFKSPDLNYKDAYKEERVHYGAGLFDKNQWQKGVLVDGKMTNTPNQGLAKHEVQYMKFISDVVLSTGTAADGCRTETIVYAGDLEAGKYKPLKRTEGWYSNGFKGWYYETDTTRQYTAANLKYQAVGPYNFTAEQVQRATGDNSFCHPTMAKNKATLVKSWNDELAVIKKREEATPPPVVSTPYEDPNLVKNYIVTAADLTQIDQELLDIRLTAGMQSSKAWVELLKSATRILGPMMKERITKKGVEWMHYSAYKKGLTQNHYRSFYTDGQKSKYIIVFFSYGLTKELVLKSNFAGKITDQKQVTGHTCTINLNCGYHKICYTPCGGTIEKGLEYVSEISFSIQNTQALFGGVYAWTILRDNSE